MNNMINKWIHWLATWRIWGPRCPEHEVGCSCCEHWAEHDWLFDIEDVGADELQEPTQ